MSLYRERPKIVWAVCATERRVVQTQRGTLVLPQGDYLVRMPHGWCEVIPADRFERTYEALTPTDRYPTCRCCGRRGPCVCLERGQVLLLCGRCPECCVPGSTWCHGGGIAA